MSWFLEVAHPTPTFEGAPNAPGQGMGDVFRTSDGSCNAWQCKFPPDLRGFLVTASNSTGDLSINNFMLGHLTQLTLTGPTMQPLTTSDNGGNNFVSVSWIKKGTTTVSTIP